MWQIKWSLPIDCKFEWWSVGKQLSISTTRAEVRFRFVYKSLRELLRCDSDSVFLFTLASRSNSFHLIWWFWCIKFCSLFGCERSLCKKGFISISQICWWTGNLCLLSMKLRYTFAEHKIYNIGQCFRFSFDRYRCTRTKGLFISACSIRWCIYA